MVDLYKRLFCIFLSVAFTVLCAFPAYAENAELALSARAAILMTSDTLEVVYAKMCIRDRFSPALRNELYVRYDNIEHTSLIRACPHFPGAAKCQSRGVDTVSYTHLSYVRQIG